MKNIIVYTSKKASSLADVLSGIEDVNVRIEDASKLRDYERYKRCFDGGQI